jgi:hypothetical protein
VQRRRDRRTTDTFTGNAPSTRRMGHHTGRNGRHGQPRATTSSSCFGGAGATPVSLLAGGYSLKGVQRLGQRSSTPRSSG